MGLVVGAVSCKADEPETASRTIGPEGGSLALSDGLLLQIEPGALREATEITVTKLDSKTPGHDAASHEYRFEPEGLIFEIPAVLDIPFPDDGVALEDIRMFVQNDDNRGALAVLGGGTITTSGGDVGQYIQGELKHFSTVGCGKPSFKTSWCPIPVEAGFGCTLTGSDAPVNWGITEWGGVGHKEADGTCKLPSTSIEFSVLDPEIWILQSWEVSNAVNVAPADEGFEDLSAVVKAFVPEVSGFDWRAAGAALPAPFTQPFFGWWSFSVWPQDGERGMKFDFELTLVNGTTGEVKAVRGDYDSTGYQTECACDRAFPSSCDDLGDSDDGVADAGDASDDGGATDGADDGGTDGTCDPVDVFELTGSSSGKMTTHRVSNDVPDYFFGQYDCTASGGCAQFPDAKLTLNPDGTGSRNDIESRTFRWGVLVEEDGCNVVAYEQDNGTNKFFVRDLVYVYETGSEVGTKYGSSLVVGPEFIEFPLFFGKPCGANCYNP